MTIIVDSDIVMVLKYGFTLKKGVITEFKNTTICGVNKQFV